MKDKKTLLIIGAKSDIAMSTGKIFASNNFNLQLAGRGITDLKTYSRDLEIRYNISINHFELSILDYDYFDNFLNMLSPFPDVILIAVGLLGEQKVSENDNKLASLVFQTNFEGPALLLNKIASKIIHMNNRTILCISSVAGDRGRSSNYIYGSSKSGLTQYLAGLRNRLSRYSIPVVTIKPGFITTKMTKDLTSPKLLTAKPDSVAKIIYKAYLAKSDIVYAPYYWRLIMLIIRIIPERIFKKLKL